LMDESASAQRFTEGGEGGWEGDEAARELEGKRRSYHAGQVIALYL